MQLLFAGPVFAEWYWVPIFFVIQFGIPILAVSVVLYWLHQRKQATASFVPFIKILSAVTLIFILLYASYILFMTYRTGILNPYTQECIAEGYNGARGDSCIGESNLDQ